MLFNFPYHGNVFDNYREKCYKSETEYFHFYRKDAEGAKKGKNINRYAILLDY